MSEWVKVCSVDNIQEGQLMPFIHGESQILVVKKNDKIFATSLICTHADAELSDGELKDDGVKCPIHRSVFDLETGKPLCEPATEAIKTFKVKIENNEIFVDI